MSLVEFFWDVASPYSYLASTQMAGLRERTGATVRFRPFLLGGVFKAVGNQPPAALAQRRTFMLRDLERWAEIYGVPMKAPGAVPFPINSLVAMRCAVVADRQGRGEAFCSAVFDRYWCQGIDPTRPAVVREVAAEAGLDADELDKQIGEQTVKDELRATTDEAVARGAFGAPTFFVGDEMFFGNDRIDHVERAL